MRLSARILEFMTDFIHKLRQGDDAAIYRTLLDAQPEQVATLVGNLAKHITFQSGHRLVALCFFPDTEAPDTPSLRDTVNAVRFAFSFGESLVTSREASAYYLAPYDNLRTPSGLYHAGQRCLSMPGDESELLFTELSADSLPVCLVLALPGRGRTLEQRCGMLGLAATTALFHLSDEIGKPCHVTFTPPLPLPEAVEHGRAAWLGRLQQAPAVTPGAPWGYEVAGRAGECLFTPWANLAVHFVPLVGSH